MAEPRAFDTLAEPVEHHLDPIKGSRFIGLASPVCDEAEALALVEVARQRWPDARHHCWAFQLADGRGRSSDDGEPGGSAGRPILAMIEGHALADVAVVVTRYFGGTKLGVGGLIRAYGGCAGQTLDRGHVVRRTPTVDLLVAHAYADTGAVAAVLGARGLEPVDAEWTQAVRLRLRLDFDRVDDVAAALRDATSGRVELSRD